MCHNIRFHLGEYPHVSAKMCLGECADGSQIGRTYGLKCTCSCFWAFLRPSQVSSSEFYRALNHPQPPSYAPDVSSAMCMNKLSKSKRFSHEYRRIQYCFACFSRSCFSLVYFSVRYTSSHVNPSPKRAVNTDMPTIKRVSDHMTRMDRAQSDAIRGWWSDGLLLSYVSCLPIFTFGVSIYETEK